MYRDRRRQGRVERRPGQHPTRQPLEGQLQCDFAHAAAGGQLATAHAITLPMINMSDAQRGFAGMHVAAFESRRASEMASLIERFGGAPSVSPSMREVPI